MSPGTAGRGMGAREMLFPGSQSRLVPPSPVSPSDPRWGGGSPTPSPVWGQWQQGQSHPAQAAAAALHPGAAKGCSDTSSQQPGLRWGQRALSLPGWHSSQDSRGTGSSRCAWKHRHRHTPGPGMSTGPRACSEHAGLYPSPSALPGLRQAGVAVPGWGSWGCPQLPCPSWLPGALPALTCLIVVVDLHLGWLQAPHGDVLLHPEGEAEGLPAQLGKGSRRGSGGALHCRGSPGPLHQPQGPTLCSPTHALGDTGL